MTVPAIEVRNVSKTYRLYWNPYGRMLERMPWNRSKGRLYHRPVHALQNIDFSVEPGQCVGLVGGNGAGKSTLLKILTGTTFPTTGSYTVRGRVASLLELGAGFHLEFTGRENIYMNAAMMGLSRRETHAKFEEILDFSELGDFIDAPLRTYSSGMVCRLGFSVAVAIEPDVLIIDEILAVGDMHFQRKCVDRIWRYKHSGKTLFFCSHSLYDIRQICDQAIWMREGQTVMVDDAVTVTNEYASHENSRLEQRDSARPGKTVVTVGTDIGRDGENTDPTPDGAEGDASSTDSSSEVGSGFASAEQWPSILRAVCVDLETGEDRYHFAPGDDVGVRVQIRNGTPAVKLCLAIGVCLSDGLILIASTTEMDGLDFDFQEGHVTLRLPNVRLLSGEYTVPIWLLDERGVHRYHERPTEQNLIVQNRTKDLGYFLHDHEWEFEAKVESTTAESTSESTTAAGATAEPDS